VLILECSKESDPGSEGRFLSHMFNLMEIPHQYVEVRTKRQLILLLKSTPYTIIHITTHGSRKKIKNKKRFVGLWTPNGTLKEDNLVLLKNQLKRCTVISTACCSADRRFRKAFKKITKCTYYIAPKRAVHFPDSIYFAHIFYHKHLRLNRSVKQSYEEYDEKHKNPYQFVLTS